MFGEMPGDILSMGNHTAVSYRLIPVKVYSSLDRHEPLVVYISKGKEHELCLWRRPAAVCRWCISIELILSEGLMLSDRLCPKYTKINLKFV